MYERSKKFFRGRYVLAEYDANDILVHIYDNLDELVKVKRLDPKNGIAYLYRHLHFGNGSNGKIYLVDVLEFVNDAFYQADLDTIASYFYEVEL